MAQAISGRSQSIFFLLFSVWHRSPCLCRAPAHSASTFLWCQIMFPTPFSPAKAIDKQAISVTPPDTTKSTIRRPGSSCWLRRHGHAHTSTHNKQASAAAKLSACSRGSTPWPTNITVEVIENFFNYAQSADGAMECIRFDFLADCALHALSARSTSLPPFQLVNRDEFDTSYEAPFGFVATFGLFITLTLIQGISSCTRLNTLFATLISNAADPEILLASLPSCDLAQQSLSTAQR